MRRARYYFIIAQSRALFELSLLYRCSPPPRSRGAVPTSDKDVGTSNRVVWSCQGHVQVHALCDSMVVV